MTTILATDGRCLVNAQPREARGGPRTLAAVVIQDCRQLEKLSEDWHDLYDRTECRNPFLTPEWMLTWWRHFGGAHRPFVITVRNQDERLVAVAPMYVRRSKMGSWGPRALCFLADRGVGTDHLTLLVGPDMKAAAVQEVVGVIQTRRDDWDYIELAAVPETCPMWACLRSELGAVGMREQVIRSSICPYALLPASFEEFLGGLSSNHRYNFRRRRRALERESGFKFVAIENAEDLAARFDEIARLHRLRFDDRRKRSSFLLPDIQRFHMETLPLLARHHTARLFLLEVGGKAIAGLYGFSTGKRFSFFQSGMDPAWSRMSAGLVLMGCSIEEAIRTGHDEFDFLRGAEDYKFMWAPATRLDVTVCYFDNRLLSRLCRPHVWLRERLREAIRQCLGPVLGLAKNN